MGQLSVTSLPSPCFVCSKISKQGSIWHGYPNVVLCANCAWIRPQALAALLADAIVDMGIDHVDEALKRFEREYWRALALALIRRREHDREMLLTTPGPVKGES
jgi:hypothetical protein